MFSLDFQSKLPIYEQLYQTIAQMAALGGMEKGEVLPSVRALAQELGVNPNTVQKAYGMLERDGIIYSLPGKGSFLSGNDSALQRQRQLAKDQLRQAAWTARECGLLRDEIIMEIDEIMVKGGKPV